MQQYDMIKNSILTKVKLGEPFSVIEVFYYSPQYISHFYLHYTCVIHNTLRERRTKSTSTPWKHS